MTSEERRALGDDLREAGRTIDEVARIVAPLGPETLGRVRAVGERLAGVARRIEGADPERRGVEAGPEERDASG